MVSVTGRWCFSGFDILTLPRRGLLFVEATLAPFPAPLTPTSPVGGPYHPLHPLLTFPKTKNLRPQGAGSLKRENKDAAEGAGARWRGGKKRVNMKGKQRWEGIWKGECKQAKVGKWGKWESEGAKMVGYEHARGFVFRHVRCISCLSPSPPLPVAVPVAAPALSFLLLTHLEPRSPLSR